MPKLAVFSLILSFFFSAFSYGFPTPQPQAEVVASRIAMIQVSAEKNNPQAQYLYGLLLLSGRIVEKNPQLALYWLTKAAEQGHKKAQKTVADLSFEGQLIPRNLLTAKKWYEKLDDTWAHFRLGFIYAAGGQGVEQNCGKAVSEFFKAGDFSAKNNAVWILSTCPEAKYRNAKKAIMIAKQLIKQSPNDVAVFDNLAAAYAEYGQFDKAISYQQKAIRLSKQNNNDDTARLIKRLKLYQKGKPYREVISLP